MTLLYASYYSTYLSSRIISSNSRASIACIKCRNARRCTWLPAPASRLVPVGICLAWRHSGFSLQDHPLNLRFSPKRLTLALMSHVFGARLGADSTQPIKIEALSRGGFLYLEADF
jgi:hypothetical protein